MNDSINYYELLGIEPTASKEEIKLAYKNMIKKWHPDINKDESAKNMSVMLNEAKTILLDDLKRQDYDEFLKTNKSKAYDNIKTHTSKNNMESSKQEQSQYSEEEKTYTKWEYYRDYIKYYKAPIWFKILVTLGIILETILTSTLQILNFILAYIICIIFDILEYLINYILGLFVILIIFGILSGNLSSFKDYLTVAGIFIGIILILSIPDIIIKFLTEKMPNYLSKLNIYLFKKCVGYKN